MNRMKWLCAGSALCIGIAATIARADEALDKASQDANQWVIPLGSYAGIRHSKLSQITTSNASKLHVAWTMSTGTLRGQEGQPLVVGNMMYFESSYPNFVYAINLDKVGEIVWKFAPEQDKFSPSVACCDLVNKGAIFQSTSDTEVIIHLVATSRYPTLLDRFVDALRLVEGAYSLICMTPEGMIACRDPIGIRPLVMGKLGDAVVFASETVALDVVGADLVREVQPGELIHVGLDGKLSSHRPFGNPAARPCIFEHVYFSRPDSIMGGRSVYQVRKAIGMELAKESVVDADLVIPVPDSGVPAALGYAQESGIPFELGIIRSHYVGRTFIQPSDGARHADVKRKHNANRALVAGKRIVLIDDSIVRGTTSLKIVQMMRDAGASEVHFRVASPPTEHSCFYGVDPPERSMNGSAGSME